MSLQVRCVTEKGGAVEFNKAHHVWASYGVAGVAGEPLPELFYAGCQLPDGRNVSFFLNRETGLVTVEVADADERGGVEVLRRYLTAPAPSDQRYVLGTL